MGREICRRGQLRGEDGDPWVRMEEQEGEKRCVRGRRAWPSLSYVWTRGESGKGK